MMQGGERRGETRGRCGCKKKPGVCFGREMIYDGRKPGRTRLEKRCRTTSPGTGSVSSQKVRGLGKFHKYSSLFTADFPLSLLLFFLSFSLTLFSLSLFLISHSISLFFQSG